MADEPDDEIAETLVEGEPYEQATLSVRRMVPLSLDRKISLAVGLLAISAGIAPAAAARRDLRRDLEGTTSLELGLGLLVLNGIVTVALGGLLLVRQQYVVDRRSLTPAQARKLVRLEDLFVLLVLFGGLFVVVPAALAVTGLLSPSAVETLYASDIRIYRPDDTLGIGLWPISGTGGLLAVALLSLRRLTR
jgi:hypothetical protein